MLRVTVAILSVIAHLSVLAVLRAAEPVATWPAPSEGEAAILAALDQPTALDFADQPMTDVLDFLSQKHKIEIQLDNKALTDAGVGSDTPITMKLDGIRLRSALRLILGQLDLTYLVRDGYLLITSKTEAESILKIKAYAVRDLVTLDSEFRPPLAPGQAAGEDYQSLINLITSNVAPTTWDEVGGPGSIREFRNSHTISFAQTDDVHEEAADLLAALRRVRDQQLAAAKALPVVVQAKQPAEELQTSIYRLLPWPRNLLWPWPYHTGGIGMGMGGMGGGGGGMGGGMYFLADEGANADKKPADAAPNSPPPAKAAEPAKPAADAASKSPVPAVEFDDKQCEDWARELASSLPTLVEPESWQPRGEGSIRLLTGALVVRQTREVQGKIDRFLAELLPGRVVTSSPVTAPAVRLPVPGPRLDWPHEAEPRAAGNEAQIEAALAKKCDLDFRDTPLIAAIQALSANGPIKVWIDHKALTDAGVGTDTPITRSIHSVPLRAAFKLILGELDLTYVIRNEVFVITSKTEAESMLTTKVYAVFDLIAGAPDAGQHARMPFRPIDALSAMAARPTRSDYQSLIENITSNVGPTTWDEVGGPGAIGEFVNAGALVISQTTEVHEEIADFLRALRQVAVAQR